MFEIVMYGIGFLIVSVCLQYILHKYRKNGNKGSTTIWVGSNAVIIICILGIATKNINYLAAIIGFVVADEIGAKVGWH